MSFYISTAIYFLLHCDEWNHFVAPPRHKFVTSYIIAAIQDWQELRTSIEKVKQKSKTKPIILAGDFNLPHIDWDSNTVKPGANLIYQHQELLDIKDEFNLEQLQLNPSRENNNLDLFFTDHPSLIK